MGDLVVQKDKRIDPYWVTYVRRRIANKKNFLGFISGATGSGKSWSGLSMCYMIDPTFSPERIVTSMKQLMRLINSDTLKSGSCILWDEAGIDISSKSWQSLTNKLVNFLMQTFRHKRFILIFTSPYLDFIDSSTRKLFHAEFQMLSIDYKKKTTRIKPFLIQYNGRNRKFYYKYLRVRTLKKTVAPLKIWNVPKPPTWLIDEYELIKTQFTSKLNRDIENQLIQMDKDNKIPERTPLTDIQKQVLILMKKFNNRKDVAKEMGLTERTIYFHISQSSKKGWNINNIMAEKGVRT